MAERSVYPELSTPAQRKILGSPVGIDRQECTEGTFNAATLQPPCQIRDQTARHEKQGTTTASRYQLYQKSRPRNSRGPHNP